MDRFGTITVLASSFLRYQPDCGMLEVVPAPWSRHGAAGTRNNGRDNMISNHFPTVFWVLVVLAAPAAPANAAEAAGHIPEVPAVASPGNAAEAEAILNAKLLVCNTCHGESGV